MSGVFHDFSFFLISPDFPCIFLYFLDSSQKGLFFQVFPGLPEPCIMQLKTKPKEVAYMQVSRISITM